MGSAQEARDATAMAALKAETGKLGTPKVQGSDLYFGDTKIDNSTVDDVVKTNGGAASLFGKAYAGDAPLFGKIYVTLYMSRSRMRPGPLSELTSSATQSDGAVEK